MSILALLCGVFLILGSAIATDVPFVFNGNFSDIANYTSHQLERAHTSSPDLEGVPIVSSPPDKEIVEFPVTGGGSGPANKTSRKVAELKKILDSRIEPENNRVRNEAVVLALKYPGDHTIDQICSIYSYLKYGDDKKRGWGYVPDPRGIDYLSYANNSLALGDQTGCVGGGDCDDFAILMAALIESIGGTTRIIMAFNNRTGGHAYTEVYLGKLGNPNNSVESILEWLNETNTAKVYIHINTETKEVWLNLDWGMDENGYAHPGGPFYQGEKHIVLSLRDIFSKPPLRFLKNPISHPKLVF